MDSCACGGLTEATSNCIPYSVNATSYGEYQVVYDVTQPISTIRFQVYPAPNGGTTDMDTASLTSNLLRSGSFEGSQSGWSTLGPAGSMTNMVDYNTGNGLAGLRA